MGVWKEGLFLDGRFPLLFVPDGVGIGLEVHRTACVLPPFQNVDHTAVLPSIRIFRLLIWAFYSLQCFICGGSQHLVRFQLVGDLLGTPPLHAHRENTLHHIGGYRVNHPAAGILRVFHIAIGHIGGQRYATLTFGFLDGSDLAAGVPGIELVEPVLDARKIVVHPVGVNGVVVVVDGDEADTILRKGEVGVEPGQCGVAAQP